MNETKPSTAEALIAYVDSHINQVTPETAWSTETVKQLRDALKTLTQQNQQAREIISDLLGSTDPNEDGTPNVPKALLDRCNAFFAANPKRHL